MAKRLGLDCRLYRNTGTYAAPNWVLIDNVRDLTLSLSKAEADLTTRANNRWRATIGTLKELEVEFEMVWDTEDTNFTALFDAFLNGTAIEFLILDGAVSAPGSLGLRATCEVMQFDRAEPLEDGVKASVVIKPAYASNAPEKYTAGS